MDEFEGVLQDFIATTNAKPNLSNKDILDKFPEFKGDESLVNAAFDYKATLASGKYKDPSEINSKFPEFFPIPQKKKEPTQQGIPFLSEDSELDTSNPIQDGSLESSKKEDEFLPISNNAPEIKGVEGGLAEQVASGKFDSEIEQFRKDKEQERVELDSLISSYRDFTKIQDEDVIDAEKTIQDEDDGDFGFFGNIKNAVLSTPTFGVVPNPFFNPAKAGNIPDKIELRKELAQQKGVEVKEISSAELNAEFKKKRKAEIIQNKKALKTEEFIENISEEQKNDLTREFRYDWAKMKVESQKILLETESIGKELESATTQLDEILKSHDENTDYPQEYYTNNVQLGQQVRDLLSEYQKNLTELNKKDEDLASVSEEIDLFRRNYDKLYNFYEKATGSIAKIGVNGIHFINEGTQAIKEATGTTLPVSDLIYLQIKQLNDQTRDNIAREENKLARPQKLDDIGGISDIEGMTEWAMNVVAEQTGNTVVLVASGGSSALGNIGLTTLGISSAGAKLNELDEEISSGQSDFSDLEKWSVAILSGTLEGVTEKISLGQINKGLRVFKSAPFKDIKQNTADYIRRNALNDLKAYSKDVSEEVIGETINDLAGKFSEQILLGKEVDYLEGLDETILSSAFMSGVVYKTPQIGNQIRKSFTSRDTNQKIAENSNAILKLTEQLNGNISETSRKKLEEKKIELANENLSLINGSINNLDNIDSKGKKRLVEINNEFFELRKEYFEVQSDPNVKEDYKEGILKELEKKGEQLELEKVSIINTKKDVSSPESESQEKTTPVNTEADTVNTEDSNTNTEGKVTNTEVENEFDAIDSIINNTDLQEDSVQSQEVTSEAITPTLIETNLNNYEVSVAEGKLDIKPKFGDAIPSSSEIKKITDQYIEKTNFDSGKKADFSDKGNLSADQISQVIVDESQNPQEVAQEIINVQERNSDAVSATETSKRGAIAQALQGTQVDKDSFSQNDDPNNVSDVNPFYFNSRNKNEGKKNIDQIRETAQQFTGEEVSLADITDFIRENKNPNEFLESDNTSSTTDLELKFQELTGLKPSKQNIEKVANNQETKSSQETEKNEGSEVDNEVPFQTESTQTRISGQELDNLVERLKKTGLGSVVILSQDQSTSKLKEIGRDSETTPNGFVHEGIVYLNKDQVKKDTPIHEFGHLWNSYAKENFKDHYNKGLDLVKDTEYHESVKNNSAYDNLNEEQQLEEALAQAIGEKGVKLLNEAKKKNFAQWFKTLFTKIAKGLGLTSLSADKLSNLSLEQYTDLVGAELLSGKEIVRKDNNLNEKNRKDDSDITNIEVVMAEAEATKKTRDEITRKLRSKGKLSNDIKNELVKFINKSIDSKRLSEIQKRELSKLLTLVKNAKTKKQLLKAFDQVNEIVLGLDNKIILRRIDKILGSRLSKKESGRRKANITDEQAEISLKSIKEYISTPKESGSDASVTERRNDRISELLEARNILDEKESLTEAEEIDYEAISIAIDIISAINSNDVVLSNELLMTSIDTIDTIFNEGRSRLKEMKQKRSEEDAKMISDIREDINPENISSLKTVKELQTQNRGILNSLKRVIFQFHHGSVTGSLDSISTLISRKGGENRDSSPLVKFVNKLKRRETLKKTRVGYFSKRIIDSQKEIFGSISKSESILNKKIGIELQRFPDLEKRESRESISVELTVSQLLNVWMNYQNPKLRGGLDANGFTNEVVSKIESILDQSVKDYGQTLFDVYDEMYNDSNEVYKNLNFHSLGKEVNYAGKVYRSATSLKEDTDALLGGITSINTTGYGSQKERVVNDKPIEAVDVNFLVKKAIQESSHYVAYAEAHREYNKILRDEGVQKDIQLTNRGTGDLIINALNYYKVRDLEQGGDRGIPIVDFFGRNIAKATLALKAKIGFTQTISIINGSFDMPTGLNPAEFISYYNPAKMVSTMRFLLKNSDYLQNRYDVGGIDQAMLGLSDLASQSELSFNNSNIESKRKAVARYYKKALDIAMLNVKLGDAVGVMGAIPAYNAWLDRYKKQGLSDADAQAKAIDKFESSVDRSQQTTSTFGKSKFQKHPIARYFTMFATAPIQNQQNAFFHFRELKRGLLKGTDSSKGSNVRNALAFLNYQFAQPMLYTYIAGLMAGSLSTALGFGDEEPDDTDKDLLRSAIMGNYNSVPVIGSISQLLLETALGKENSFGGIVNSALLDNTTKLQDAWLKAYTAPSEKTRRKNTKKAIKLTAGLLSGMPNYLFDNIDAIDEIYWNDEIDNEVKFLKAFGYSDFVIEQARKQRISREKSQAKKDAIKRKYENSIKIYNQKNKKTNPIFKPQKEKDKRN